MFMKLLLRIVAFFDVLDGLTYFLVRYFQHVLCVSVLVVL